VLQAAVELADRVGLAEVSMRTLARTLGVVPMALYKHVANKDELLGGMVDAVIAEIPPAPTDTDWHTATRARILDARRVMLAHPWASALLATRSQPGPAALGYLDSVIATFTTGGFPPTLTHQVMHTLGSRVWGFNLEAFPSPPPPSLDPAEAADPAALAAQAEMFRQLATAYPHVAQIAAAARHDPTGIVGPGCDDQAEFEFGLDLLLDGFRRLLADARTHTD
jgi:AcrR family transcriptional regulator